jgi:ABC-type nitrate/sulfonate/bicarbonate transport system substrate-binding protein
MWRTLAPITAIALVISACGGTAPSAASPSVAPAATVNAATAETKPAKLVVGFSEIYEGALPMWYAASKGIFKKNGLDVDLRFTASSTGVAALLAGEVQVFQGGGSEVLSANVEGGDIVLVGNLVPIYPYVFMVSKDINSLSDLKGKKVGVSSAGSTSDIATRVGLSQKGLDPDRDVVIVPVGSSQNRTAALLNGSIQGGLDQPPGSIVLEAQGLHVLFDLAAQKLPVVNNGIAFKKTFIGSNKDVVQRYIDSLVQAIAALRKDKQGGMDILKAEMKVDDATTLSRTYDYAIGLFPELPYAKPEHLADSVRVLGAKNDKIRQYDLTKMLDESFVKSAGDRGLNK